MHNTSCFGICILNANLIFQLPAGISDNEISKLASLFNAQTLEAVALQYLRITKGKINNCKVDNLGNDEGFNRELLYMFKHRGRTRKVIYIFYGEQKQSCI